MAFEPTLDAILAVSGLRGQPRNRLGKLHAEKGYDFARCRRYLKPRGITARIARRAVESKERFGRHRWGSSARMPGLLVSANCAFVSSSVSTSIPCGFK